MYTINIWGNCMTRDIVSPLTKTGKVKVLQYVGGGGSTSNICIFFKVRF